jgi:DNA polymerase III delta prime subunit
MNNGCRTNVPWVEKYRPCELKNVILDTDNEQILSNVIEKNIFPNLLLYGSPGTGKTTTIINITKMYLEKYYTFNKENIIHLNASDERGIDIIRNQLQSFVVSKSLYNNSKKIVILDEIDYMTESAQIALKILIEDYYNLNVTFCLICNYISKINNSLRNMFVILRFNNLPVENVESLLSTICDKEGIVFSKQKIKMITRHFKSDIRSMINYIQTYNHTCKLLDTDQMSKLYRDMHTMKTVDDFKKRIHTISKRSQYTEQDILIYFCKYLLEHSIDLVPSKAIQSKKDKTEKIEYDMMNMFEVVQDIFENNEVNIEFKIKYLYHSVVVS